MERRVIVRGVVYKDGRLLVVRRKSSQEHWSLPGGSLVNTEGLEYGLRREFMEEMGVEAEVGRLLFVQQFYHYGWNNERLELFFLVENVEDFVGVSLAGTTHGEEEIAEIGWVDPQATEGLLPEFLSEVDIEDYMENVRAVLVRSSF